MCLVDLPLRLVGLPARLLHLSVCLPMRLVLVPVHSVPIAACHCARCICLGYLCALCRLPLHLVDLPVHSVRLRVRLPVPPLMRPRTPNVMFTLCRTLCRAQTTAPNRFVRLLCTPLVSLWCTHLCARRACLRCVPARPLHGAPAWTTARASAPACVCCCGCTCLFAWWAGCHVCEPVRGQCACLCTWWACVYVRHE